MAKIGRNEKCPCQSGKKFKHCCADKVAAERQQRQIAQSGQITLMGAVQAMTDVACKREVSFRELGVFFLYSTAAGDAWLLEMTDGDAIQIARAGEALAPEITETPETIEVNWSHQFAIRNKMLEMTAYKDKAVLRLPEAPSKEISAALKRIHRKFTPQQLRQVHVDSGP